MSTHAISLSYKKRDGHMPMMAIGCTKDSTSIHDSPLALTSLTSVICTFALRAHTTLHFFTADGRPFTCTTWTSSLNLLPCEPRPFRLRLAVSFPNMMRLNQGSGLSGGAAGTCAPVCWCGFDQRYKVSLSKVVGSRSSCCLVSSLSHNPGQCLVGHLSTGP